MLQLFGDTVHDEEKNVCSIETCGQCYKTFFLVTGCGPNKLERLSLQIVSSLVQYLQLRPKPTRVKHISCVPLLGRLLDLLANIRPGQKEFARTNALAY